MNFFLLCRLKQRKTSSAGFLLLLCSSGLLRLLLIFFFFFFKYDCFGLLPKMAVPIKRRFPFEDDIRKRPSKTTFEGRLRRWLTTLSLILSSLPRSFTHFLNSFLSSLSLSLDLFIFSDSYRSLPLLPSLSLILTSHGNSSLSRDNVELWWQWGRGGCGCCYWGYSLPWDRPLLPEVVPPLTIWSTCQQLQPRAWSSTGTPTTTFPCWCRCWIHHHRVHYLPWRLWGGWRGCWDSCMQPCIPCRVHPDMVESEQPCYSLSHL